MKVVIFVAVVLRVRTNTNKQCSVRMESQYPKYILRAVTLSLAIKPI